MITVLNACFGLNPLFINGKIPNAIPPMKPSITEITIEVKLPNKK